jgi:DNA-binding PadR family transcriptional regulator
VKSFKKLERRLRAKDLEMLNVMSDGAVWGFRALMQALSWGHQTVRYHLNRLIERGEVVAIPVKRVSRKTGSVETVRAYRITPKGLWTLKKGIPAPESQPESEESPPSSSAIQLAIHIVAWSKYATRALLHLLERGEDSMYGLTWAMTGRRYTAGNWSRLWGLLYKLKEWGLVEWEMIPANHPRYSFKYRFRITEKGRQVAQAILSLAGELIAQEVVGGAAR